MLEPSTKHSASHGRFSGHAGHMLHSVSTGQTWADLSTSRKSVYILDSIVGVKFILWATFGFYQISSDSWVNGNITVLTEKNSLHEADQLVISISKQLLGLHRQSRAGPQSHTPHTCLNSLCCSGEGLAVRILFSSAVP